MRRVAGVELGGTKCVMVIADADGQIANRTSIPTLDAATTMARIEQTLADWWQEAPFEALGIGSFGPLDLDSASPTWGSITSTAKPGWQNMPVATRLADRFAVPIAFDTDVNGAAFAERRWGAARGLDDVAYATVGTGVGVGLLVNGRATRGIGHCEAGHLRIARSQTNWPGNCPFHGDCVEGIASGPAIAARTGADPSTLTDDHPVWDEVVDALAHMIQAIVGIAGPVRILIGGGVVHPRPALIGRIEARVRALIGAYLRLPAANFVTAPGLGALAGPLGPIALAMAKAEAVHL